MAAHAHRDASSLVGRRDIDHDTSALPSTHTTHWLQLPRAAMMRSMCVIGVCSGFSGVQQRLKPAVTRVHRPPCRCRRGGQCRAYPTKCKCRANPGWQPDERVCETLWLLSVSHC